MRYQLPCRKGAKIQTVDRYKQFLVVIVVVSNPRLSCKFLVSFSLQDHVVLIKIGNDLHIRGLVALVKFSLVAFVKFSCYAGVAYIRYEHKILHRHWGESDSPPGDVDGITLRDDRCRSPSLRSLIFYYFDFSSLMLVDRDFPVNVVAQRLCP
jgi:hypothetical protein